MERRSFSATLSPVFELALEGHNVIPGVAAGRGVRLTKERLNWPVMESAEKFQADTAPGASRHPEAGRPGRNGEGIK